MKADAARRIVVPNNRSLPSAKQERQVMRNRILLSATILALNVVLVSSSTTRAFAQSDSSSDQRLALLLQRAPQADINKDGVLTRTEAATFLKAQRKEQEKRNREKVQPTHGDIAYGEHKRHVMDLYLAKASEPTSLVIHIHGGGFVGGDKRAVSSKLIKAMHGKGISVASIHYRFVRNHRFPAPFTDAARAVQFLRHHAQKYNLDPTRFAATGNSAGAGISLWLATRDDMADPRSDDPVSRQSTRISCASVSGAQASYDPRFWREAGLGKGLQYPSFPLMFGVAADDPFDDPKIIALAEACAPIEHVSKDDPPIFLSYGVPDELNNKTSLGAIVHHPRHGQLFKKQMDAFGIECHVVYPGGPEVELSSEQFLIKHLKRGTDDS
jgi:acetyl esterase/lipase